MPIDTVPPDGVVSPIVTFFIAQGPIGLLCLFLLAACWRLWTVLEKNQEARIRETKESMQAMQEYTKALSNLAEHWNNVAATHQPTGPKPKKR